MQASLHSFGRISFLRASSSITQSQSAVAMTRSYHFDATATPYPAARRDPKAERIFQSAKHGKVSIPEPYIWLEDADSEETRKFTESQSAFTQQYLTQGQDIRGE